VSYVLDASVAVRWYLADEAGAAADAVLERVLEAPEVFAVPELFFFEVYAVLARSHRGFEAVYTDAFLPVVASGPLRYPMTEALAVRASRYTAMGLTGYDAVYAGLARELGALWLTFDSRAHKAIASHALSWDLSEDLPVGW
jgi:predicted nucleic acid-binding protein